MIPEPYVPPAAVPPLTSTHNAYDDTKWMVEKQTICRRSTDAEIAVMLCRNMLEEVMDDQEDMGDINLSSRPKREEQRRQRDREALEREVPTLSSLHSQPSLSSVFAYAANVLPDAKARA